MLLSTVVFQIKYKAIGIVVSCSYLPSLMLLKLIRNLPFTSQITKNKRDKIIARNEFFFVSYLNVEIFIILNYR